MVVDGKGQLQDIVEAAQEQLQREKIGVLVNSAGFTIVDDRVYTEALARLLNEQYGVCATAGGPDDEIGIKLSDTVSEQYDVVTGWHQTWANRTVVCSPARF